MRTWPNAQPLVTEVWRGLKPAKSTRRSSVLSAEQVSEIRSLRTTYVKQHVQLFIAMNGRVPERDEYGELWAMACRDVAKRGS